MALNEENYGKGTGYVGTTAYMSPERSRGEGHLVDGRSDIFSLSIVFYEMLAGRRPFRGDSRDEITRKIVNHEHHPPRQIDDRIPGELERICLKACRHHFWTIRLRQVVADQGRSASLAGTRTTRNVGVRRSVPGWFFPCDSGSLKRVFRLAQA